MDLGTFEIEWSGKFFHFDDLFQHTIFQSMHFVRDTSIKPWHWEASYEYWYINDTKQYAADITPSSWSSDGIYTKTLNWPNNTALKITLQRIFDPLEPYSGQITIKVYKIIIL